MAQTSTYLALLPSANANKPKFSAMMAAAVQPFVDAINFFESLPFGDGVNETGDQLTTIGLWVGVSRYVTIPLDAWFSFDTTNLGFDQGVWWQPYQPTSGSTILDDTTMLLLIGAKILWNRWDGTTPTLYTILAELFSTCVVTIADNLNHSITVTVTGTMPNPTLKLMALAGLLPYVPAGVSVSYTFTP
jgi:hypothetical protein